MAHLNAGARVALFVTALLWGLAAILHGQRVDQQNAPALTFRAGVETVVVSVTVRGSSGRLDTSLQRDDFQLLVDRTPVPTEVFSKERHPLALGILLHTGQPASSIGRIRELGRSLVQALEPADRALVGTFANEFALSPFATSDREILDRVLREEVWPSVSGNFVGNAVDSALGALSQAPGKRALTIVGSDPAACGGFPPCLDEGVARRHAVEQDVTIYGVVVRASQPPLQVPGYPVERMAGATGGAYFLVAPEADARAEMAQVVDELRHEYLLGFTPAEADDRVRAVTIRVAKPGVRVSARLKNGPAAR
jgi:VWFA-related protein